MVPGGLFAQQKENRVVKMTENIKNHLNLKDPSGFFSMELLSRFELETSSLPRMRSTN
jgi:hypothetical protein